jgi:hypothetical protein
MLSMIDYILEKLNNYFNKKLLNFLLNSKLKQKKFFLHLGFNNSFMFSLDHLQKIELMSNIQKDYWLEKILFIHQFHQLI